MTRPFRVLVVGGAGVFGSRLVDAILASTDWTVVVAGRDLERARSFAASRNTPLVARSHGRVFATRINTADRTRAAILATEADVVVDAAGPYQDAPYTLAYNCIAARVPYIDLADARQFVASFGPTLDRFARAMAVPALTGASSTPALSNAALDAITRDWTRVDTVTVAISPGNRAPRGHAVVRAILSYVGRPLRLLLDGRRTERPGWGMTQRMHFPGLGPRWLSLCDTPDLDIIPARLAVRRTALFLAGLELPPLHLGLAAASLLVRARLLRTLVPVASAARAAASLLQPFGTDRGGMLVQAEGRDAQDRPVRARWSLVAEGGDGPTIPALPALAMLRRIAAGRSPSPGARPCAGLLHIDEIEAEMRPYRIAVTRSVEFVAPGPFQRALGPRFHALPPALRVLHGTGFWEVFNGTAAVLAPTTRIARIAARLTGFPTRAGIVAARVTIARTPTGETWTRTFGARTFSSHMAATGRPDEIEERFGPLRFRMALDATPHALAYTIMGWRIGFLRLPRRLAPAAVAAESVDAHGRFRFDVSVRLPLGLGQLALYTGILEPEQVPPRPMPRPAPRHRTLLISAPASRRQNEMQSDPVPAQVRNP